MVRVFALPSLAAFVFAALLSPAASASPPALSPAAHAGPPEADHDLRVEGPSFGEYATLGVFAGGFALALGVSSASETARWRGGLLFDDAVRGGLRIGSESGRKLAGRASDMLQLSMMAYPLVVDALVTTALVQGDHTRALHMAVEDSAAFLATGLAVSLMKNVIGRERPSARDCPTCVDGSVTQSFPSGHTAIAFTGAGLMCAQHSARAIYGNVAADRTACLAGLGLASATGLLRVAADRHYASDVLIGGALGFASGYFLPRLVHKLFGDRSSLASADDEDRPHRKKKSHFSIAPQISGRQLGVAGTF